QGRAPSRRAFLQSAAAASLLIASGARAQTPWPDRVVRIVVPYPPGGSTDVLARILAERLNQMYGQTFMIENRPGAGGNIGIATVTGSTPDGYTVGAATIGHFAINQFLYASMPYDPERDMIPATLTWELPNVFVVPAEHVPFRGAAQTIPAMLSGAVDFAIDNLASYISLIQSGQMRALAVTSAQRWPTLPAVPTMAEAGVKDFVVTSWAAFVLPTATPRPIVD